MSMEWEGWQPEVARRISALWDLPKKRRRVAVFDFDETVIRGDIGELYGNWLSSRHIYRYDREEFWDLVEFAPRLGWLRQMALRFEAPTPDDPLFQEFVAEVDSLYERKLAAAGKAECYAWAATLHVGMTESEMTSESRSCFRHHLSQPFDSYSRELSDGFALTRRVGIRPHAPMLSLRQALVEKGWEVWVVSATNIWTVREAAEILGFNQSRVIGNQLYVDGDELSCRLIAPALYGPGKVTWIEETIGIQPDLVVGDSSTDREMLGYAKELAILLDRGDDDLLREGRTRGWAIQAQELLEVAEWPGGYP